MPCPRSLPGEWIYLVPGPLLGMGMPSPWFHLGGMSGTSQECTPPRRPDVGGSPGLARYTSSGKVQPPGKVHPRC